MDNKGQNSQQKSGEKSHDFDSFVLEKGIFSSVFDKDIRRIYIYKKAERLARAVHLIAPAFSSSAPLRARADVIAMALVDGAILPPRESRAVLARELLALSSLLSIARTSGMLSAMNADLIGRESHLLLEEIATYEEPRMFLEHTPTLAELSKGTPKDVPIPHSAKPAIQKSLPTPAKSIGQSKGHITDTPQKTDRREHILAILRSHGPSYIKEISTTVRGVSEKTIQRELQSLTEEGIVKKEGERRWTKYSVIS